METVKKENLSFSAKVKKELSKTIKREGLSACCKLSEAYGLFQCASFFTKDRVGIKTEHLSVATVYKNAVIQVCGIEEKYAQIRTTGFGYAVEVLDGENDKNSNRLKVLKTFGHNGNEISLRINRGNMENEDCFAAYLRGAFLSAGSISDPQIDYHMEISLPYYRLSNDFLALMREVEINVRLVERKGNYIIYIKESSQIEDFLTLIGATWASLELMNIKMVKDIRNNVNRITNCESANISKTVTASVRQNQSIRKIKESEGGLEALPEELGEVARIRLENPDMSLRELGEALSSPLSRSGVNHRLQRILEFADEI